jgi:hypothetical protein
VKIDEFKEILDLVKSTTGEITNTGFKYAMKRTIVKSVAYLLELLMLTAMFLFVRDWSQHLVFAGWDDEWSFIGNILFVIAMLFTIPEIIHAIRDLLSPEWIAVQRMFNLVQRDMEE